VLSEIQEGIEIDLIEVLDPLDPRPGEKLLTENRFEFLEGGGLDAAAHGIRQVGFDRLGDGHSWFRLDPDLVRRFLRDFRRRCLRR